MFIFFVLEEEWNPDGKGRPNDAGELYISSFLILTDEEFVFCLL